tara:strand:- start:426 stop:980 length:555 start_codon:yes stop_codon:yes gene_type:complete
MKSHHHGCQVIVGRKMSLTEIGKPMRSVPKLVVAVQSTVHLALQRVQTLFHLKFPGEPPEQSNHIAVGFRQPSVPLSQRPWTVRPFPLVGRVSHVQFVHFQWHVLLQSAVVHTGVTFGTWLFHTTVLALMEQVDVALTVRAVAVLVQNAPFKQIVGDKRTVQRQVPTPRTCIGFRTLHLCAHGE